MKGKNLPSAFTWFMLTESVTLTFGQYSRGFSNALFFRHNFTTFSRLAQ